MPYYANWNAIAFFQVGMHAYTIEQIYEGKASKDDPPTLLLAPEFTTEPTPIPLPGQIIYL